MKINLDGQAVTAALAALVDRGAAMGLDVRMPDGIDVTIVNEVLHDYVPRASGGTGGAYVAPQKIAIRWYYKPTP